ncbi:MAG: NAD-dependent epimerase/dehydratase family protein [Planctomycetes bacterium]|nr:NAD-dependent epimerase/dehydratase family protein [Planctomycetota bacterium]
MESPLDSLPRSARDGRRVLLTGGAGFLGRAVCARLRERDGREPLAPAAHFDLRCFRDVGALFEELRPEVVVHVDSELDVDHHRPGADGLLHAHLVTGLNLVEQARVHGVQQVVLTAAPPSFGARQQVATRAFAALLQAYRDEFGLRSACLVPAAIYGPGDDFDPRSTALVPLLIRTLEDARVRGAASARVPFAASSRCELLYVDDCADAVVRATAPGLDAQAPIELAPARAVRLAELAARVAHHCGYAGRLDFAADAPAPPRSPLAGAAAQELLGWSARVELDEGLDRAVSYWRRQRETLPLHTSP